MSRLATRRGQALAVVVAVTAAATPRAAPLRAQAWPSSPVRGSLDARTAERVASLFARWDGDGPGAAVAILDHGRIVFSRGFGLADLEQGTPIRPDTRFHVASVSKQFTAFAVARLAERGELSLADDVRRHIPELPSFGRTITLRNLLEHTSGLRDQWTLLTLAGWRMDDVITQDDVLGLLYRQRELNFPPGSEHLYSNSGYTLLAEVVARVGGRPFAEWMRDEVFEPLGLHRTHVHADHHMIVPGRARSYVAGPEGRYIALPLNYATFGATSVFTTSEDLLRWADRFMTSRRYRTVFDRMMTPGRLSDGRRLDYALGVLVHDVDGRRAVEHDGGDAGFRSELLMFPDDALAVAILGNDAGMDPADLARRAAAIVLETHGVPVVSRDGGARPGPADPAPEAGVAIDAAGLDRVVGLYGNDPSALVRRIERRGDRLLYDRGEAGSSWLRHIGEGRFRMLDVGLPIYVRFEPDDATAERMIVEAPGEPPLVAERLAPAPTPLPTAEYAGTYVSPELGVGVRIVARGGDIALLHPRQGEVPLVPVARDRFDSKRWWLGIVRFDRGPDGGVTGFRSSSGRVRNLRFERREGDDDPSRFALPPDPGGTDPRR